jgi:hypothetical protein
MNASKKLSGAAMPRVTYVQVGKELYLKGTEPHNSPTSQGPMIMGDLPDFVSHIDQKRYSGRAGLREHCRIHDVVPNAELKGLPTLTMQSDQRTSEQKRASAEQRKQFIINQVNSLQG